MTPAIARPPEACGDRPSRTIAAVAAAESVQAKTTMPAIVATESILSSQRSAAGGVRGQTPENDYGGGGGCVGSGENNDTSDCGD